MKIGVVLAAAGICLFLVGLYGVGGVLGDLSPLASSFIGGAMLIAGLGVLGWYSRHAAIRGPNVAALGLSCAALLLHGYENFARAEYFSVGMFAWTMLPYATFVFLSCMASMRIPAAAAVGVALVIDLIAHYDVFVSPKGSTAALALIFAPLWNLLVFGPVAIVATWSALRTRASRASTGP